MAQDLPAGQKVAQAHDEAIREARSGQLPQAIALLDRLAAEVPTDLGIAWDRVVVLTWANRDAEAIRLYKQLPKDQAPDYAVAAIAGAYRDIKDYAEALDLYRHGKQKWSKNPVFVAGEVRTMTDMANPAPALGIAELALKSHGDTLELLLAAAYAAIGAKSPVDALRYTDRALKLAPQDRGALQQHILAMEAMGAPAIALQFAKDHPSLMASSDIRRLEGSAAAELIRFGELSPPSESERFAAPDRAIATLDALIQRWSQEGPGAAQNVVRARFDRLLALHDRLRMKEVVSEFEDLWRASAKIPEYVLPPVADAYLSLRRPNMAVYVDRWALALDPQDVAAHLGLALALVETEDFDGAIQEVDEVAKRLSPWIYLKGSPLPIPNQSKFDADVAAANARLYADDLPEAQQRFSAMTDLAPNNITTRLGLANVYGARGWPRLAKKEIEIATTQEPRSFEVAAATAENSYELQNWPQADAEIAALRQRFPESPDTRRLSSMWQNHNRWEFQFSGERSLSSATSIAGGSGILLGGQLYSPPIANQWRPYAGYRVAHERESEGNVTERIYDTGVAFSYLNLASSAEVRLVDYGPKHVGGTIATTWSVDDYWQLSGQGEILSSDTPRRALLHHTTANSASGSIDYRASERRNVKVSAELMTFSDGNLRSEVDGAADQRLITRPHFDLGATLRIAASQNTLRSTPYYNPRHDALGTLGLDASQIIYRRYEFAYSHSLLFSLGPYWEQGFGTGLAWNLEYRQTIKKGEAIQASIGVGLARQPYDGSYEDSIAITFNVGTRF